MEHVILDSGESCKVVHRSGPDRILIDYEGLVVAADRVLGAWILSGKPVSGEEKEVLEALIKDHPDTVTVLKG